MERPDGYKLHKTLRYVANIGRKVANKEDLRRWAEQAEKMEKYIDYLEKEIEQLKVKLWKN